QNPLAQIALAPESQSHLADPAESVTIELPVAGLRGTCVHRGRPVTYLSKRDTRFASHVPSGLANARSLSKSVPAGFAPPAMDASENIPLWCLWQPATALVAESWPANAIHRRAAGKSRTFEQRRSPNIPLPPPAACLPGRLQVPGLYCIRPRTVQWVKRSNCRVESCVAPAVAERVLCSGNDRCARSRVQ